MNPRRRRTNRLARKGTAPWQLEKVAAGKLAIREQVRREERKLEFSDRFRQEIDRFRERREGRSSFTPVQAHVAARKIADRLLAEYPDVRLGGFRGAESREAFEFWFDA